MRFIDKLDRAVTNGGPKESVNVLGVGPIPSLSVSRVAPCTSKSDADGPTGRVGAKRTPRGDMPMIGKKIVIVSHHYPPHIGGLEVVASKEARGFADRGNRVKVLTSAYGSPDTGPAQSTDIDLVRVPAWNGLEKWGIPFPVFAPGFLVTAWRMVKWAEVVHIHDTLYISSWIAALLCRMVGRPFVVTKHVGIVEHRLAVRIVQNVVDRIIGRRILEKAEVVVAINPVIARDVVERNPKVATKTRVVLNGVDNQMFRPAADESEVAHIRRKYGLPAAEFLALFVGRFVPKKRLDVVLNCDTDTYRMVIVGGDRPANMMTGQNQIFLGPLSQDRLAEVYRAADVFVCPSVGEFLPLTVLEAAASGLPVLTEVSSSSDASEFLGAGLIAIGDMDRDLANSLGAMASDCRRYPARSGSQAADVSEQFSWEAHMRGLSSILADAMTRRYDS